MEIRAAVPDDAEAIEAVRVAGWQQGYQGVIDFTFLDAFVGTPDWRRKTISDPLPGGMQLVAVDDGEVVGWISGCTSRDEDAKPSTYEVSACYVHPDRWREGIGERLMNKLLRTAGAGWSDVTVWTLRDTPRSVGFYQSMGFRLDGFEKEADFGKAVAEVRLRKSLG